MTLNDCGCCAQTESPVRAAVSNDPGLNAIDYRIGRFGQFKQAMKNALDREPSLDRLTTRDDSDPIVATVDAWATVLDVLTFYQERIANEHYLRTCTEYRSVVELGKALGYRPAPGTAATTWVALRTDDTGHGPQSVRVDAGTRIQSQPGQDELPQVYETQEPVVASPAYNALAVRHFAPDRLAGARTAAYFKGTDFDVKVGDTLLFVAQATKASPAADTKALAQVTAVSRDSVRRVTRLTWTPALPAAIVANAADPGPDVFIMRLRTALFGYNAIDFAALPLTLTIGDKSPEDGTFIAGPYAGQSGSWASAALAGSVVDLDSLYPAIGVGSWVVLLKSGAAHVYRVDGTTERLVSKFAMSGKATELTLAGTGLGDFSPKTATVLAQSEPLSLADAPIDHPLAGAVIELATKIVRPETGRRLLIRGKRPRLRFAVTQVLRDATGASVRGLGWADLLTLLAAPQLQNSGQHRFAVALADGTSGFVTADAGAAVYLPGAPDDGTLVGEIVTVSELQTGAQDDPTDVVVATSLTYAYDRASSTVYGNVAPATHGETKGAVVRGGEKIEVLGSGNASKPFQTFELKNTPLTYLAARTDTGYRSALEVRVNGVLWLEVPTLYGEGPRDRVYTARQDDQFRTRIQFGDGAAGARTETGVENVTARYRVGAGLAGRVRADQLNMLLTRPLGLTEATNPLAATGGSDPERTVDAQANIPRSILTLGRIVSVQDFEDHAARYPGIAKAQAVLLWNGTRQVVHLTVSGPDGEAVDTADLEGSIDSVRDTHFPLVIQPVETLRFAVTLAVLVRQGFLAADVLPAARAAVATAFGFAARFFSEAVTASQILAAVQPVAGVEAANVTLLDFATLASPTYHDILRIEPGRAIDGTLFPAQILLVDPARIAVQEMTREP